MEKVLFPQLAPEARLEAIKKTAVNAEELTFVRHLSDAEIDHESRRLAKFVKDMTELEEEKSQMAKEYGDKIKSIKELMKDSSQTISKGEKEVTEKVYKFINYDSQEVAFYDSLGNLVKVRKAMNEELQLDLFGNGDESKALTFSQDADYEEVTDSDSDSDADEDDEEDDRPYPYNQD